ADTHGAGAELLPERRIDDGLVGQLESGGAGLRDQANLEPGHHLAVLPGDGERLRLVAALDRPAGVAFELVPPALAQLAADRQEPPRDALRAGQGVPEIGLVGGVPTARDGDPRRLAVPGAAAHLPGHQTGRRHRIDVHARSFYKFLLILRLAGRRR